MSECYSYVVKANDFERLNNELNF